MQKNLRILITGNKGFIGKRLQEQLSKDYSVFGIDREMDITEDNKLERAFTQYKPDLVIHCAAEIGRLHGEEAPRKMLKTNVIGTLNVVLMCLKFKVKLINFATSEICYPLTNIYGISKDAAENIVKHYSENYRLKAVSVRPFMIYGPGQVPSKYKSALDRFVHAKLTGKKYEVHKGTERAWCHVNDFIEAIKLIIKKEKFNKFETYNIGTNDYKSMFLIAKMIGGSIKIVKPQKFLTKIKRGNFLNIIQLGWKPKITLEEGIKELITWHESLL